MQQNAVFKNQLNGDQANINEFIKAFPTADAQNAELQRLFTKVASEGINEQFDSYGEGDKKVYYVATSPLKEVVPKAPEKPAAADKKAAEQEKVASNYYNEFITNPVNFLGTQANFSEALNYDGNIIQLNLSKPGEEPDFKAFDPTEPQGRQLLFDYWINNSSLNQTLRDKLKEINSKNKGNIIPKEDEYYGQ